MGFSENIQDRGYYDKGLYDLLYAIVTNFNAMVAKVEADASHTHAHGFVASYAVTTPSIGPTYGKVIRPNCLPQGKVNLLLYYLRTNFNAALTAFAADDQINGTTVFTNQKFATTEHIIDVANARIKQRGEFQDEVADFLDNFVDRFNQTLSLLDGDATLTSTDYNSTLAITDVIEALSSSSSSSSYSSSSSSSSSKSSSSSCSSSSSRSSSSSCSSSSCRSSSSSSSSKSSSSSSKSSSSSSSYSKSSSSSSSSKSSSSSSKSSSSSSSYSKSSSSCSSSSSSESIG